MTTNHYEEVTGLLIKQPSGDPVAYNALGGNADRDWLVIVERGPRFMSKVEHTANSFDDALKWASKNL